MHRPINVSKIGHPLGGSIESRLNPVGCDGTLLFWRYDPIYQLMKIDEPVLCVPGILVDS